MQYGASTPAALVQRAVAWGQPALALTDRDGLYGAVRFVQACTEAGIDPILGVDLAVSAPTGRPDTERPRRPAPRPANPASGREASAWWPSLPPPAARPTGRTRRTGSPDGTGQGGPGGQSGPGGSGSRTPVRGGAIVDPRRPRVTVLARGMGSGLDPGAGWGRLCRLVTATHLSGERGEPVATPELIAELATAAGEPRPTEPSPQLPRDDEIAGHGGRGAKRPRDGEWSQPARRPPRSRLRRRPGRAAPATR